MIQQAKNNTVQSPSEVIYSDGKDSFHTSTLTALNISWTLFMHMLAYCYAENILKERNKVLFYL